MLMTENIFCVSIYQYFCVSRGSLATQLVSYDALATPWFLKDLMEKRNPSNIHSALYRILLHPKTSGAKSVS